MFIVPCSLRQANKLLAYQIQFGLVQVVCKALEQSASTPYRAHEINFRILCNICTRYYPEIQNLHLVPRHHCFLKGENVCISDKKATGTKVTS